MSFWFGSSFVLSLSCFQNHCYPAHLSLCTDTVKRIIAHIFLRFKVSSGSSQFFVTSLAGGGGIMTDRSAGKGKRQVAAAHEFFEVFFTEKAR